jgi:hypothetical protein
VVFSDKAEETFIHPDPPGVAEYRLPGKGNELWTDQRLWEMTLGTAQCRGVWRDDLIDALRTLQ